MRALLLAALLPLAACSAADAGGGRDRPGGPRVARDYALSGFDRVVLAGSDDVIVRVGSAFAVRAEAPQDLLDRLDIRVEGGALKVGRRRDAWNWGGHGDRAVVTVALPRLAGATVAGSGDMTVDRVAGGDFRGTVTGSGDLDLGTVRAAALKLDVAGSGGITARGSAASGDYSIAGSGNIDAKALAAGALSASVAGSGNIDARSKGQARVSIVGSGDVTVAGATCTVSKVGSGDARCG